jgi:hypothetical protein
MKEVGMRSFMFVALLGAALAWPVGHSGSVRAEGPEAVARPFTGELLRTLLTDEITDATLARLEAAAAAAPRLDLAGHSAQAGGEVGTPTLDELGASEIDRTFASRSVVARR